MDRTGSQVQGLPGERTQKATLTLEVLASALESGGIQSYGVHGERGQQERPWLGKPGGQVPAMSTPHELAADPPSWMGQLCPPETHSPWGAPCPVETGPSTHSLCLHTSCQPPNPHTLRSLQPGSLNPSASLVGRGPLACGPRRSRLGTASKSNPVSQGADTSFPGSRGEKRRVLSGRLTPQLHRARTVWEAPAGGLLSLGGVR